MVMIANEEESLPSWHSLQEKEQKAIAEERRLCYVGITRTKNLLVMTYARARYARKQRRFFPKSPSRFLEELPNEFVVDLDAS